jgi:hypothetical protein
MKHVDKLCSLEQNTFNNNNNKKGEKGIIIIVSLAEMVEA